MGNLNMTHYYAPDDRWNDTGILLTVLDKDGWEYAVPKDVQFSYESTKQVLHFVAEWCYSIPHGAVGHEPVFECVDWQNKAVGH